MPLPRFLEAALRHPPLLGTMGNYGVPGAGSFPWTQGMSMLPASIPPIAEEREEARCPYVMLVIII